MKLIISLLLLTFSLNAHSLEQDKVKHFTATTAISSSVYIVSRHNGMTKLESAFLGIFAANMVGLLKEMNDSEFDNRDIGANVLGSAFGAGMVWSFE